MKNEFSIVEVESSRGFEPQLKMLFKRYRQIRADVQEIVEQLQAGELPGDPLVGLTVAAFKVRVRNSDTQKGKSGEYRLIYQAVTSTKVVLLTIYSKSDQSTIAATEIEQIVAALKRREEG